MTAVQARKNHEHATSCGVRLGVFGQYIVPLTTCCGVPATEVGTCSGCWRYAPEGMALAAILGHPQMLPDLRKIIMSLGRCRAPAECAKETAKHFERMA